MQVSFQQRFFRILSLSMGLVFGIALLATAYWPSLDLKTSAAFYTPGKGFPLANNAIFLALHDFAYDGARILGALLVAGFLASVLRKKPFLGIDRKGYFFLFVSLLVAPGLIGNIGFKNHWGRARPREVAEFGGTGAFSPALVPQLVHHNNGSFVSGDAAFGFYLPAIAYVVPRQSSRRTFWATVGMGVVLGFTRLAMGAHFLSDNLFAALFMLASVAALHAGFYGMQATQRKWREWFWRDEL